MNNNDTQLKNSWDQEPYVGMPISRMNNSRYDHHDHYDRCDSVCDSVDQCPLAMAYVPWQRWCDTYEPAVGWHRGTIFPELDLPFLGGGAC